MAVAIFDLTNARTRCNVVFRSNDYTRLGSIFLGSFYDITGGPRNAL